MKYITSALVLIALFGSQEQVNAIRINQKAAFTDDLVKSLAEEMQKDLDEDKSEKTEAPPAPVQNNTQQAAQAPAHPHQALAQHKAANASNHTAASAAQKTN